MTTSKLAVAAALCTLLVIALIVFSADDLTGSGTSIVSGWVFWFLLVYGLPAAIIGYVIGILRNIAADTKAGRRELEATRRELEAIRCELADRGAAARPSERPVR